MRVRTAVIPAAGLGTRFLPATKAVPKELLPILDTPALQLVVDEAVGAGVDHVVLVTSRDKPAIEDYFRPRPDVDAALRRSGRDDLADRLSRIGAEVRVSFAYQDEPRGLGHAVGCARELVGDEPFAILLPDELMGDPSLLERMARLCEQTSGGVVALKEMPHEALAAYGVVDPVGAPDAHGVVAIRSMVEKPAPAAAPSPFVIIGRYVVTPDVFDLIGRRGPGAGGEIQLTDALRTQAESGPFHGLLSDVARFDTGTPFGWLTAVVELGLAHADIGPRLRPWLAELLAR